MTGVDDRRCADVCLASGERLIGTATRVDVWFFIEYPDAWRAKAIDDNDLAAGVNDWIAATVDAYAAQAVKARPQFIRQARRDADRVRLMVLDAGKMASLDLENHDALTAVDVPALELEQVDAPVYFVCTNGLRDNCCSLYGMPLYRRLFDLVGARAWQTSHVGGHRYAPNVLVAPTGELFGRVFSDEAAAFVTAVDAGDSPQQYLRGQTGLDAFAQVATAAFGSGSRVERIDGQTVEVRTENGIEKVVVCESDDSYEVIPSCGKPAEVVRSLGIEARGVS